MLDLKFIRENLEVVKNKLSQRNLEIDLDHVIEIDQRRREIIQEVETLRNERNTVSEIIAAAKKEKKGEKSEECFIYSSEKDLVPEQCWKSR